jgi:DNA-directed RNA polymerase specialized sigma24 family protein
MCAEGHLKKIQVCRVILEHKSALTFRIVNHKAMMIAPEEVAPVNQALASREKIFETLYFKAFPLVAAFVSRKNGSFQEAKDIFQDALVIFYESTMEKRTAIASDEAYVLGIAKHLWIRKFNRDKSTVSLDDLELAITLPDDYFPSIQTNKLLAFLERAGNKCLDLLRAFYYDKQNMAQITNRFGFASERSATVQKFKCLEKVRDAVKEKAMNYEDFTE